MAINNEPTIQPRTVTGIFTNYIAKVLPLAFDESMSYYECLCALLKYINDTIVPDINNTNEGLGELQGFYEELQSYVNNYFDNLDVQEEIDKKLDHMAEDGTLSELIGEYIDPYKADIDASIEEMENKLQNITSGSPRGTYATVEALTNADPNHSYIYLVLADGKWYYYNSGSSTWVAGGVYQSTSVSSTVQEEIDKSVKITDLIDNKFNIKLTWESGSLNTNTGVPQNSSTNIRTGFIDTSLFNYIEPITTNGYHISLFKYDANKDFISNTGDIKVPFKTNDCAYVRFCLARSNYGSGITVDEGVNGKIKQYIPYILNDVPITYNDIIKNNIGFKTSYFNQTINYNTGAIQNSNTTIRSDFINVNDINELNIDIKNNYKIVVYKFSNSLEYQGYLNGLDGLGNILPYNRDVELDVSNVNFIVVTVARGDYSSGIDTSESSNINLYIPTYTKINNKGIVTWIDDDTNSVTAINKVYNIAESLGIKCTFACVTNTLDNSDILNRLKELQEKGYHITSHSDTHTKGTVTDPFWYPSQYTDVTKCEADLIKSLVKLQNNGFLDSKFFVTPGGNMNSNLLKMISKWCPCIINADQNDGLNHNLLYNRKNINRIFIRNTHTLAEYEAIIDKAYENNDWLIFGTHSGINDEWDAGLIESVLDYAINKGLEFMTFNQAWNYRQFNYDLYDMYK